MHLTDHLTDVQLNEYLDHEINDRGRVEAHLASCTNCAARLTALQALFDEIESLPEVALSRSIAAPVTRRVRGSGVLPRSLRLTVTLQGVAAISVIILAAPFVGQFISPYLLEIQSLSFADMFLPVQSQWTAWLDLLSQFQVPTVPEFPVVELSSLFMTIIVVGASLLWLIGNGLLLRNQVK